MVQLEHTQEVLNDLGGELFNEATADVILKVQDERLPAHRLILNARSEYFKKMLSSGMKEKDAEEVEVGCDFGPSTMKELLRYIYTGSVKCPSGSDSVQLMACADCLGFAKLRDDLRSQVAASLSPANIFEVWLAAAKRQDEPLVEKCLQFVDTHANYVLESDFFSQLDAPMALRALRADGMQGKSQLSFEAAASWYVHWSELAEGGGERAEEAAQHLRVNGSEMRKHITSSRKRMRESIINLGLGGGLVVESGPEYAVRKMSGTGFQAAALRPSTNRTRVRLVRRAWVGPRLVIALPDAPTDDLLIDTWGPSVGGPHWPIAVGKDGLFYDGIVAASSSNFQWHTGVVLDVVTSPTADGRQKVQLFHRTKSGGVVELMAEKTQNPAPALVMWVVLDTNGDEVAVKCL